MKDVKGLDHISAAWIISGRLFECLAKLEEPVDNAEELVQQEFWDPVQDGDMMIEMAIGIMDDGDYFEFDRENIIFSLQCGEQSF